MHHYTYLLINQKSNMKYIGVRSCKCDIEKDPYMGSSYAMTDEDKEQCDKVILGVFDTRIEANQHEVALHKKFDVARNPEFWNLANATEIGYDVTQYVPTKAMREKTSKRLKGIPLKPEHVEKLKKAQQKRWKEGRGVPLDKYKRGEEHKDRKYTSKYHWKNIDGSEFLGTNLEFKEHIGQKHIQNVTKLIKGEVIQLNGWHVVMNLDTNISSIETYQTSKHTWVKDDEEFIGTPYQLSMYSKVPFGSLNKVAKRIVNSAKGWSLRVE